MRPTLTLLIVFVATVGGTVPGLGQEPPEFDDASEVNDPYAEPLVTDRPDFTESSSTVGFQVAQVEMGYTFVHDDGDVAGDKTQTHTSPEILFRYGLTEGIELRVGWTYAWEEEISAGSRASADGGTDLFVGTKIELAEQCCWRPEQAILVHVFAPTGDQAFTTDDVEFSITYAYSWELCNEWSLGANTSLFTDADGGDDFVVWTQSVSLGIPINDCWGMYVEYFGLFDSQRDSNTAQNFFNGGLTYLWNDNVQFDLRAGFGLNDEADDLFAGTGVSLRF